MWGHLYIEITGYYLFLLSVIIINNSLQEGKTGTGSPASYLIWPSHPNNSVSDARAKIQIHISVHRAEPHSEETTADGERWGWDGGSGYSLAVPLLCSNLKIFAMWLGHPCTGVLSAKPLPTHIPCNSAMFLSKWHLRVQTLSFLQTTVVVRPAVWNQEASDAHNCFTSAHSIILAPMSAGISLERCWPGIWGWWGGGIWISLFAPANSELFPSAFHVNISIPHPNVPAPPPGLHC